MLVFYTLEPKKGKKSKLKNIKDHSLNIDKWVGMYVYDISYEYIIYYKIYSKKIYKYVESKTLTGKAQVFKLLSHLM